MKSKAVRIRDTTYEAVQKLLDTVSSKGWTSIGSVRKDKASVSSLLDEAVILLTSKAAKVEQHGHLP